MKFMPAIIPIAILLVVYGAVAFVQWELSPGKWEPGARFLTVFVGGSAAILATAAHINFRKP